MKKARYSHKTITLLDKKIAVVIDLDNSTDSPSVTNTIENIAIDLKTVRILYQGSDKVWFYWNRQYIPIIEDHQPILNNEEKAIDILTNLFYTKKIN
jgi:hypothetical protein